MEDELSSSSHHTNAVHYDIVPDAWGYRSQLIGQRAQELLGVRCIKLAGISRGANHKVYRVAMDDGRTVIGRVLSPSFTEYGAGAYPEDTMEAEIAAMRYVKTHSSIPVPEVYYHDKDKNGEVGGEWMLLEDIRGTNLYMAWPEMSIDQRQKVGLAVVDVWAQLMRLRFGAIGSINSPGNDAETFYVGPMTFMPTTIGKAAAPPRSKCGPFSCVRDWLFALARLDMAFLREALLKEEEKSLMIPVISDIKAAPLPYLDNNEASDPSPWSTNVLFHVDLGAYNNIMVDSDDPTIITGVIDWEGACVVPLWFILPRFSSRLSAPHITQPDELGALEELRCLMVRTLLDAVPEWAKLITECREARVLYTRAAMSTAEPRDVRVVDRIF